MPRRGHTVALTAIGIYLAQVLLFSTYACWHNQLEYADKATRPVPTTLAHIANHPVFTVPAHICGYACGYGFYAPRVGSHYLTEFRIDHRDGQATIAHYPSLSTLEGRVRYRAFTDLFGGLLPAQDGLVRDRELPRRVARATAKSLTQRTAARLAATRVSCRVGAWYIRPLRPAPVDTSSHYLTLFETDIRP